MPLQSWKNSIIDLGAHSRGASQTDFAAHWDPSNLTLSTADGNSQRCAWMHTHFQVTGDQTSDVPDAAMYRIACAFIISHLDPVSIQEAYNHLREIYNWQLLPADSYQAPSETVQLNAPIYHREAASDYAFEE